MTGDQSLLKHLNRMAVIRLVKAEPGLSRVELAQRTGLTKTTVGLLVLELIREGWLRQIEPLASPRAGRRPTPLALDRERLGLLGAEVGVDYLNIVSCNLRGEILSSRMIAYRHGEVGRSVSRLCRLVADAHSALVAQGRRTLGLGVGVPGIIDPEKGILRFAPNLGWYDIPFAELLRKGLAEVACGELAVNVLNEANAAALSEYLFGREHHDGPLVYLSMGIGLGAGVVLGGRLYLGQRGLAGEVGHTILERRGPPCACGRRGCAEAFVSQRAVSRHATGKNSPILAIEELAARIEHRDGATVRAAARAGEYLGVLMQNLRNTLDPEVLVLGGPLCQLGPDFIESAKRAMLRNAGLHDETPVSIRLSRFGLDAGAVGAAGSVLQGVLNPSASPKASRSPSSPSVHGAARSRSRLVREAAP
ncbi:MAG TPA: ROK family transcriptional regulator [Anaeromyxobacteraceae bacterium]|nr:ROK family transcriptional regulator [Anaeromyxobacteraceae bacterium]